MMHRPRFSRATSLEYLEYLNAPDIRHVACSNAIGVHHIMNIASFKSGG